MDPELIEHVRRAQQGDLDAYSYVVTATRGQALATAAAILGDRHAAEDAAQDAFCLALRKLPDLRQPAAFPGWLRALVRTAALRAGRRRSQPPLPDAEPAASTADPVEPLVRSEVRALVRAAVRDLTGNRKAAVEGYYLDGLSVDQTAARLGVPAGSVKRLLHEARERLRPRLVGLSPSAPVRSAPRPRPLRLPL